MIKLKVFEYFDPVGHMVHVDSPKEEININEKFISEFKYKEYRTSDYGDYKEYCFIAMNNGNMYLFDPEENIGVLDEL